MLRRLTASSTISHDCRDPETFLMMVRARLAFGKFRGSFSPNFSIDRCFKTCILFWLVLLGLGVTQQTFSLELYGNFAFLLFSFLLLIRAFPRDVGIFLGVGEELNFVRVSVNDLVIVEETNHSFGEDETEVEVRCNPTHPGCFYAFSNLLTFRISRIRSCPDCLILVLFFKILF